MSSDKTSEKFARGMQIRREVMGATRIDRVTSAAQQNPFLRPLEEMVTEGVWGTVWTRNGLDRKTRSLISIAMLFATERHHEMAIHINGALNNGVTEEEIQEVLLHGGCFCGWPAAVAAFKVAVGVLDERKISGENTDIEF
jgi:4-carboxymuconolactone decarboxylase